MRTLSILFVSLFLLFIGTWTYRANIPVKRPDETVAGESIGGEWWSTASSKRKVDDEWKLDNSIEPNYIPVPGETDLFMVIDISDGKILSYKKRTRQLDGSYTWQTVDPNIPDDYEAVEGLENVYKVTDENGNVSYKKYIRNDDDTFAFVDVDEKGEMINRDTDATTIDSNHVLVSGNTYKLLDSNGVMIGYDKRVENEDGTFSWIFTDVPDIEDIAKEWSNQNKPQLETEVNMKDAYDQLSNQMESEAGKTLGEMDGNGGTKMDVAVNQDNSSHTLTSPNAVIVNNGDGTHTVTETLTETKTIDGWTSTYETKVVKTYDSAGNLLQSQEIGPEEVNRYQSFSGTDSSSVPQADPKAKKAGIKDEMARISSKVSYASDVMTQVTSLLNAQRASGGLNTLTVSDTASSIAKLRAADMAIYDSYDTSLPTYGSLNDMLSFYNISARLPGENIWKTQKRSADEIHTRLQTLDNTRKTRMSAEVTEYGIGICEVNGAYYICEVFL